MTRASAEVAPPRLASRDDRAGRLLREADQAFRSQFTPELASWKRFQIRRQRRWFARFAVAAAVMAAVVVFVRQRLLLRAPVDPPTLVAEHVLPPQPSSTATSVVPPRAAVDERRISPPASASARIRLASRVTASPMVPARGAVPASSEPLTDTTCRAWASQGHPERAVDCYQAIARESGIGAEVALYEAARLSTEALDDAPRALALLQQHSVRFPNSVLRVEVQWLEIRSLERAGRLDEALSASETLLDSAVGRTLAPKLHLLRGRIYAGARHECALALPEYVALLGEPGSAGDEAEFNRARCLEQLRRPEEARSAYERYLGRADARSAEAARARLIALSNPAQPPTQPSEGQR
jgi:hypothetical protein